MLAEAHFDTFKGLKKPIKKAVKILVPNPKKLRDLGENQGYKYPEDYMPLKRKKNIKGKQA